MKRSYTIKILLLVPLLTLSIYAMQPSSVNSDQNKSQEQQKPCDGGTSKCGGCQSRYKNPFNVCHALFDAHVKDGRYLSGDIMGCYERALDVMLKSGLPVDQVEAQRVVVNYTRMHEEELQKLDAEQ